MLTVAPLKNVFQTGAEMQRLTTSYYTDVLPFQDFTLKSFFNVVRSLKYIPDPVNMEFVQRPKITLSNAAQFRDCDDKAVLMGAYLYLKKIPFRFVAVSHDFKKPLHHVLIQVKIDGKNKIVDATYPKNRLYHFIKPQKFTPITDWMISK